MNYKVTLISSGQPSLNPRLIKEADALSEAGYSVLVLYAYWNDWGTTFDNQLLPAKKWKAVCVGGDPKNKWLTYFLSRLIYRFALTVNKKSKGKLMANFAASRASYFLIREAPKHVCNLYIGHNLGAIPALLSAAKRNNTPCGFDAEDFHRYETSDDNNNYDVALKTILENKYIPHVNYFTASSPQIANAYRQIFPALKPVVLLNVFLKSSIVIKQHNTGIPLKLFWFSQTIGPNRGLDDVVKALQLLDKPNLELHLLGNRFYGDEFIDQLSHSGIVIKFHNPVHPDKLVEFAAQFDIGLALEPGFSINNDLALSNKVFTYMQAGLAIIASNTTAQANFMNNNPQIGSIYQKGNVEALTKILLKYDQHREELYSCKVASFKAAHEQYNWETEGVKFLEIVKNTLNVHI